jgi:GDP-L-fucose synthase
MTIMNSQGPIARTDPIFVAGGRGMVGSALIRRLMRSGFSNVLAPAHSQLDLLDGIAVRDYLLAHQPRFMFIAAAKVGGIHANNSYRAQFLYENLMIQNHLIHAAHLANVQRLMFLGSSCIYPKLAAQPIREEYLLNGELEPTNEPYAIAKIAGIKMCESYNSQYGRQYVSVMPTNLYGPNDNYDLQNSHVLPALIRKAHEARESGATEWVVWGTGTPKREFLYVDDLAHACVFLMEKGYAGPLLNIGTGSDVTIAELAELVARVVGYDGRIVFDASKPDGTPRKLLDVSKLNALGWHASTALPAGILKAYRTAPFYVSSEVRTRGHAVEA